jgi:hypothetical protein
VPASKEELKEYNRYEVRLVVPHFSMQVVGIYQSLQEARAVKKSETLYFSRDIIIIYDTIKQQERT